MLWRRSNPPKKSERPSVPVLENDFDRALDTLTLVLRKVGQHSLGGSTREPNEVGEEYDAWATKLSLGEPPKEDEAGVVRDWGGVRRFVSEQRKDEHDHVSHSLSNLREAVRELTRLTCDTIGGDREADARVETQLGHLVTALNDPDTDHLRREASALAELLRTVLDSRKRRESDQVKRLRDHVRVLREQLSAAREKANTDALTGLFNASAFHEQLERVAELGLLFETEPCLLLIDVDDFASVNDSLGRAAGDRALRSVADTIVRQFLRREDFVARHRGEAFAILVPDSRVDAMAQRAEHLRQVLAGQGLEVAGQRMTLTLSLGLATMIPGEAADTWLSRTEQALHEAQRGGGNRLVVCT
ncbi:MAG: diguanylate cyclase [Polyangiaceae bacterium]